MSLRDRSNPTVAYSRPAATFIILHFPCVLFSEGGLGCIASQAVMKYAITIRKNKTGLEIILNRFVVPRTRLELTRANAHHPLKVACLPIPPPGPRFPPQRVFRCANIVTILFFPKYTAKKLPGHETDPAIYEGENETYIEASVENSSSILYDKEIRNKPRTRRTKRNV